MITQENENRYIEEISEVPQIKTLNGLENDIVSIAKLTSSMVEKMSLKENQDEVEDMVGEIINKLETIEDTFKYAVGASPNQPKMDPNTGHIASWVACEISSDVVSLANIDLDSIIHDLQKLERLQNTNMII